MKLMLRGIALAMSAMLACTAARYSPTTPSSDGKGSAQRTTSSPSLLGEERNTLPVTVRIPETEGIADFLLTGPKAQTQTVTMPNGEKTVVEFQRKSDGDWIISCLDSNLGFRGGYTLRISDGKLERAFGQVSKYGSYAANHSFSHNSTSARAVFRFTDLPKPKVADDSLKATPLLEAKYQPSQPQANMIPLSLYGIDANLVSRNQLKVTFYHARATIQIS